MINKLDAVLSRAVARWVEGARRAAIEIVALALVATAGTSLYVSQNLGIQGGTEDMLSPELPFRKHWDEFREAFPRTFDPIYVVVEADSAARARDAAELLAADLERQPQLFEYVDLPGRGVVIARKLVVFIWGADLLTHSLPVSPVMSLQVIDGVQYRPANAWTWRAACTRKPVTVLTTRCNSPASYS